MIAITNNLTPAYASSIEATNADGWFQLDFSSLGQTPAGLVICPAWETGTPEILQVQFSDPSVPPSDDKCAFLSFGDTIFLSNGNQIKNLWLKNSSSTNMTIGYIVLQ